jgi:hypothetical protein
VIPIHFFDDDVHVRIGRDQCVKLTVGRNRVASLGPQIGETNASFQRPTRVCLKDSACQNSRPVLSVER